MLNRQASRQAQHLAAVRLHREIRQGTCVGYVADVNLPAEYRRQRAACHGVHDGMFRPVLTLRKSATVCFQELACYDRRLPDASGEALLAHAILDAEHTLLAELTLRRVRLLGGVDWKQSCLLAEGEVAVTRTIGGLLAMTKLFCSRYAFPRASRRMSST